MGTFIVIEGSDGSGKSTHFSLLLKHLRGKGYEVAEYKFPRYDYPSSYFVTKYLNGEYGDADSLGAYIPSLFYALDRFDAAPEIRKDLAAGKVVLCDRFVGSNMAHQGQKIADGAERQAYFDWLHKLEFDMLGIPRPDLNIVLLMPPEHARGFMTNREKRGYTQAQLDVHEADTGHLERAVAVYGQLCQRFSHTFTPVKCCSPHDELRSIEEIQEEIRDKVEKRLTA